MTDLEICLRILYRLQSDSLVANAYHVNATVFVSQLKLDVSCRVLWSAISVMHRCWMLFASHNICGKSNFSTVHCQSLNVML